MKYQKTNWFKEIEINGKVVKFKVDTRAVPNILTYTEFKKLELSTDVLQKTTLKLTAYSRHTLKVMGRCKLTCKINLKEHEIMGVYDNPS